MENLVHSSQINFKITIGACFWYNAWVFLDSEYLPHLPNDFFFLCTSLCASLFCKAQTTSYLYANTELCISANATLGDAVMVGVLFYVCIQGINLGDLSTNLNLQGMLHKIRLGLKKRQGTGCTWEGDMATVILQSRQVVSSLCPVAMGVFISCKQAADGSPWPLLIVTQVGFPGQDRSRWAGLG